MLLINPKHCHYIYIMIILPVLPNSCGNSFPVILNNGLYSYSFRWSNPLYDYFAVSGINSLLPSGNVTIDLETYVVLLLGVNNWVNPKLYVETPQLLQAFLRINIFHSFHWKIFQLILQIYTRLRIFPVPS